MRDNLVNSSTKDHSGAIRLINPRDHEMQQRDHLRLANLSAWVVIAFGWLLVLTAVVLF